MRNESLIQTLDTVRIAYNQRKRMTSNLVSALKGVHDSLSKATRAWENYRDDTSTIDHAILLQARESFGALQVKEGIIDPLLPGLHREARVFALLEAALKDAMSALDGTIVDVVKLDHACSAMQAATIDDAALTELFPQLEQELQQAQQALGSVFGAALRDALAEQGIEIGGRPPRFEIGRFEINANFVNRTAMISYGKDGTTPRVPLSVDAVIRAYQRDAKDVMGRQEDGSRWLAQLYEAWENVRRRRGATGERVNIVECYVEMTLLRQPRTFRSEPGKRSFRDYTRAQFAYDFFTFTNNPDISYEGKRVVAHNATKSHAESSARSFWIVEGETPHTGRYIGDIEFK